MTPTQWRASVKALIGLHEDDAATLTPPVPLVAIQLIREGAAHLEAAEKERDQWREYHDKVDHRAFALHQALEAAEKRALELALALDAALMGWHDAPPTDQADYDSIAELRAVLEAKP